MKRKKTHTRRRGPTIAHRLLTLEAQVQVLTTVADEATARAHKRIDDAFRLVKIVETCERLLREKELLMKCPSWEQITMEAKDITRLKDGLEAPASRDCYSIDVDPPMTRLRPLSARQGSAQ